MTTTAIFLIGFMGSGKSHWGKIWSEENNITFIDLDAVIEKEAGMSIAELFEKKGEDHFRHVEAAALRAQPLENVIIACGGGTPCFHDNIDWMNQHGITIYLICRPADVLARVEQERDKRPLLRKMNKGELLFFIEQKMEEREPIYSKAQLKTDSSQLQPGSLPGLLALHTNGHA